MNAEKHHTQENYFDPDPIVDILLILSALANIATIGSFVKGNRGQPDRRKRSTLLSLDHKNSALRVQLNSLAEDYGNMRRLQASSRRILGFQPTGLRVGTEVAVEREQMNVLLRLRKGIIRRSLTLNQLVVGVMSDLSKLGPEGETTYALYGTLQDRINDLLENKDQPLEAIEAALESLLADADRISAHVGGWLSQQLGDRNR